MALVTLYKGSIGLNTKLDPERLKQIGDDGLIEFSSANNISIDDRGQCSLRNGNILQIAGEFHSIYCAGADCFAVQEFIDSAAIVKVANDLSSVTIIKSGIAKNHRMSWGMSGFDVFYSNTVDKGYICDSVNYNWPINTYQGATADMQFASVIPSANKIGFQQGGKVFLAVDNGIFVNHLPFQYGLFELSHGNIAAFDSTVLMIATVKNGFYAGDGRRTWFFRKLETDWYHYKQELVEDAPAIEWALAHDAVNLRDINIDMDGFGRIWASANGICLGTDDGVFINLTKEKVKYPSGYAFGACLLKDYAVIHTAW